MVSWQPLSLVEARGHITYDVMVTPTTGSRRRRQATQGERVCTLSSPCKVPANESSVIVWGLDRNTSYSVTVMAVNSEDKAGPTSMPITVPGTVKHFFILTNIYASMWVLQMYHNYEGLHYLVMNIQLFCGHTWLKYREHIHSDCKRLLYKHVDCLVLWKQKWESSFNNAIVLWKPTVITVLSNRLTLQYATCRATDLMLPLAQIVDD